MTKPTEAELVAKGLTAPRVTPERIAHVIVGEYFHVPPGTTLTLCVLTLRNGFTVTGESACASPENFDREICERYAREAARSKVWALEGYALRERLAYNSDAVVRGFLAFLTVDVPELHSVEVPKFVEAWERYRETLSPDVTVAPPTNPPSTAKERAIVERDQLAARLEGLTKFQATNAYRDLPFETQALLDQQRMHMTGYFATLQTRLDQWVD